MKDSVDVMRRRQKAKINVRATEQSLRFSPRFSIILTTQMARSKLCRKSIAEVLVRAANDLRFHWGMDILFLESCWSMMRYPMPAIRKTRGTHYRFFWSYWFSF